MDRIPKLKRSTHISLRVQKTKELLIKSHSENSKQLAQITKLVQGKANQNKIKEMKCFTFYCVYFECLGSSGYIMYLFR